MRILLLFSLAACGGQIVGNGNGDASTPTDTVTCGDAGTCNASSQFCRAMTTQDVFTEACVALPSNCHACDCADPPTQNGESCVCSSDGDAISVTCHLP